MPFLFWKYFWDMPLFGDPEIHNNYWRWPQSFIKNVEKIPNSTFSFKKNNRKRKKFGFLAHPMFWVPKKLFWKGSFCILAHLFLHKFSVFFSFDKNFDYSTDFDSYQNFGFFIIIFCAWYFRKISKILVQNFQ